MQMRLVERGFVSKHLNHFQAHQNRAYTLYNMHLYKKAIAELNGCILVDNTNSIMYYLRGMSKIEIGKSQDGCNDFNMAFHLGYQSAKKQLEECNKIIEQ